MCEHAVVGTVEEEDYQDLFNDSFRKELRKIEVTKHDLVVEMLTQAENIGLHILPELEKYFGSYEVFSVEEKLFEKVQDFKLDDYNFKGFIDLVVATKDGKIHLIDWKTCSWGWDARKKNNKVLAYQLVFYKHFYARKHPEVTVEDIETHFVLLKRTAKQGKKIEFVRVTAGKKRIENALNTLLKALHNIEAKRYTKNRLACTKCPDRFGTCEFYQTEYCR